MSLKLYFSPGACSFVPHVMLQLSGSDFEPAMVKLHKGEQNGDEYKAINPRSQVPVNFYRQRLYCAPKPLKHWLG